MLPLYICRSPHNKEGTTVNLTVQRLENGEYVEKEIPITLNARPQEEENGGMERQQKDRP